MGGPHKAGDKQRTYWITPELEERFKNFAKSQGLSMSELIRISIDHYRKSVLDSTPPANTDDKGENDGPQSKH